MIMVLIPGIGTKVGGAARWFRVGSFSIQPSEFVKFALAVYLAYSMSKKGPEMAHFSTGLVPHLLVAGVFMCLIILQPDLGTAVIIGCWLVILLFVGGVNPFQLAGVLSLFAPVVFWLVLHADYRLKRWWAFLHPWKDPTGIGFQIVHSFLAFGSGGVFGMGLGKVFSVWALATASRNCFICLSRIRILSSQFDHPRNQGCARRKGPLQQLPGTGAYHISGIAGIGEHGSCYGAPAYEGVDAPLDQLRGIFTHHDVPEHRSASEYIVPKLLVRADGAVPDGINERIQGHHSRRRNRRASLPRYRSGQGNGEAV